MTPELNLRLESSLPPFNGSCVYNARKIDLSHLRELLRVSFSQLSIYYFDIEMFHDWHEHDGYLADPQSIPWDTIHAANATNRTLFDSRDDDHAVRIAIYPRSFDWLLRYNIDYCNESDWESADCDFDFTAASDTKSSEFVHLLLSRFPGVLAECRSRDWFLSRYGG